MTACDLVVVSYNSERDLREFWAEKQWRPDTAVDVVDNSSADRSAAVAEKFARSVVVLPNRGLSVANNVGFSLGSAPYVVFCNPDLDIVQSDVDALVARLERESCVVTGRLVDPDGTPQPNARRFPTLRRQLASKGLWAVGHRQDYYWGEMEGLVRADWVLGACIAMRRSDLVRLGGWPNQYFLYFEDVALCREAWRQQIPVYVDNDVRMVHGWQRASKISFSAGARFHARSAVTFYVENPALLWPRARAGLVGTLPPGRRARAIRQVSRAFRRP